jgi:hypothetical protein
MNIKLIIFFFVALLMPIYLRPIWHNRKKKLTLEVHHHPVDFRLGWFSLALFFDGALFALVVAWLFT